MNAEENQSFWKLLKSDPALHIVIPKIQRDFALGRTNKETEAIRNGLVGSMFGALKPGGGPLSLGLVFGAETEENDEAVITLYDGQQRLTALFLLHWYLAWRAGKDDGETKRGLARFSYETRLSSRDFCQELVGEALDGEGHEAGEKLSFGSFLRRRHSFPAVWWTDPTVEGMTTMLDSLHEMSEPGIESAWDRLCGDGSPITFDWLRMDDSPVNEDLYVKLNGRGKPLTRFEKLKAWLESPEAGIPEVFKGWKHKLDNEWTGVFWEYAKGDPESMQAQMLHFFLGTAFNEKAGKEDEGRKTKDDSKILGDIADDNYLFKDQWKWLFDRESLEVAFKVLGILQEKTRHKEIDKWAREGGILRFEQDGDKKRKFVEFFLTGWPGKNHRRRLLFFGFVRYLVENPPGSDGWNKEAFVRWMRIVRNLVANSNINRWNLPNALRSLRELAENQRSSVDAWWADHDIPKAGIDPIQAEEEKRKATLRHGAEDRRSKVEKIQAAEDVRFLMGRVGFLLDLAGIGDGTHRDASEKWERFRKKAKIVGCFFDKEQDTKEQVPKKYPFLLQRALLTIPPQSESPQDYTWPVGSKYSFGNDRNEWRGIFQDGARRRFVGALIDKLEEDRELDESFCGGGSGCPEDAKQKIFKNLSNIADNAKGEIPWSDWRRWIIEFPEVLEHCEQMRFAWWNDGNAVVLIKGERFSGQSRELRTCCLWHSLKEDPCPGGGDWKYEGWHQENSFAYCERGEYRMQIHYLPASSGEKDAPCFELRLFSKTEAPGLSEKAGWEEIPENDPRFPGDPRFRETWKHAWRRTVPLEPDKAPDKIRQLTSEIPES